MEGAELFESKFNCDQSAGHEPKLSDCDLIDWEVWNSFVRPKIVPLLPREGLVLSIANNTCAFVVLNNDFSDTYSTCVGVITQVFFEVESRCNSPQDGFIGSVQSTPPTVGHYKKTLVRYLLVCITSLSRSHHRISSSSSDHIVDLLLKRVDALVQTSVLLAVVFQDVTKGPVSNI
ncbi:hypothetical protein C8J57DRAFT_1230406 [Mycena rebaudengoi]|nr:hypothetical protein C8J57DRAFT_1230406 [Mycena rebaudengoi]